MSNRTGLQVRVRTSEDAVAQPLMEVPFGTDLSAVLRDIGSWGINTSYGEFDRDSLSGQFVVADEGAYFEVVVDVEQ